MDQYKNDLNQEDEPGSISAVSPAANVRVTFNFPHSSSSSNSENGDLEYAQPMNTLTIIGRVRKCSSLTAMEYLLFAGTIVTLLVYLCFSTLTFMEGSPEDFVFSVLIIVNAVFILFYLTHGIFTEEPFELVALTSTFVKSTVLFVANYLTETDEDVTLLNFTVSIVSAVFTLMNITLALRLAWRYWITGNLVFRTVGADMKLQRMCRLLLLAQSLLAVDAQWTLIILVLVFQQGFSSVTNEQLFIIAAGMMFIGLWLFVGYFAMRFESMYLTWLFVGTSLFQPVYIVYLIVDSFMSTIYELDPLKTTLYISAFICLSVHFSLLAVISCVSMNYGKGLTEKVYGRNYRPSHVEDDDCPVAEAPSESSPLLETEGASTSRGANYLSFNG